MAAPPNESRAARAVRQHGDAAPGRPSERSAVRARTTSELPSLRLPARNAVSSALVRVLDRPWWSRIRLAVDVVALCLASATALLVGSQPAGAPLLATAFSLLVLATLRRRRAAGDRLGESLLDTMTKVLGTMSLAAVMMIALGSLIGVAHPVSLALRLWLCAALYLGVARVVLLAVRKRAQRTGVHSTPTLVVGAGLVGEQIVRRLTGELGYGLRPVGFLDSDPLPRPAGSVSHGVPVLGGADDLADAIERTNARHVILAFSNEPDYVLVDKVRQCQQLGVEVSIVPRLYELINGRASLDHVGGLPLQSFRSVDPRGWQFAVKHTLERGVAFFAVLMLAPLMGAIAIAVRLSSPGPALFRERRVGRDGHEFDLLKFRTMREATGTIREATGHTHTLKLPADSLAPGGVEGQGRRTRVGGWLRARMLDELPQFINVLRGDVSLVGPRAERPESVARFTRDNGHYEHRHRVKSGITGWAQVHGLRGQASIADRVEWDNYYIQNWTLRLDLRILALTVAEFIRARKDL
jgi:exopolysaccharide biosynthesis polyprenyl glycosylphosphotransferase